MKILMRTLTNQEYEYADCNYAIADMTEEEVTNILTIMKLMEDTKKSRDDLVEMSFYDDNCRFYPTSAIEDEEGNPAGLLTVQRVMFEDHGWVILQDDFVEPEEHRQIPEDVFLVFGCSFLFWKVLPKHVTATLDTETISFDVFKSEIAARVL